MGDSWPTQMRPERWESRIRKKLTARVETNLQALVEVFRGPKVQSASQLSIPLPLRNSKQLRSEWDCTLTLTLEQADLASKSAWTTLTIAAFYSKPGAVLMDPLEPSGQPAL